MTAATLPIALAFEPNDLIPFEAARPWPRCVPDKAQAKRVLFAGADLPQVLSAASVRFLIKLSVSTRELFGEESADPASAAFADAVATLWRIEMALALSKGNTQDEAALSELFEDAAHARDALVAARPLSHQLDEAIQEVRFALMASWGALLRRAANHQPVIKLQPARRPVARAGVYATVKPAKPSRNHDAGFAVAVVSLAGCAMWLLAQM